MPRLATRRRAVARPRVEVLEDRSLLAAAELPGTIAADGPPPSALLARFAAGLDGDAARSALASALGAAAIREFADGPAWIDVSAAADSEAILDGLRATPGVVYAEPDAPIEPAVVIPNDTSFARLWGLNSASDVDLDLPEAWSVTTGSAATIVAVIDTGLDLTHPEFAGRVWVNPGEFPGNGIDDDRNGYVDDVHGWNFDANTANVQDDNGHGTHVSGTIGAAGNNRLGVVGINWNARILPLKALDARGGGSTGAAVAAIYYAADRGARVINASWGGASHSQALADAILYANARGAVFVTAAGNESANNDLVLSYPASYRFPNVISVASIDAGGGLSSFSNYGAGTVDLAAPGGAILSTVLGGYSTYSGTSMAAPHVAGVASLVAGLHPEYTAAQVVGALVAAAQPLATLAGRTTGGGLLVNAARAVGYVEATTTVPPPGGGTGTTTPTPGGGFIPLPTGGALPGPVNGPNTGLPTTTPVAAPTTAPAAPAIGWTAAQVESALIGSPEYFSAHGGTAEGFVAGLYRDLLGREPDPAGAAVWIALTRAGMPRGEIARLVLNTDEARRTRVARWYQSELRRSGSLEQLKADAGVGLWAGLIGQGAAEVLVHAAILGSAEYLAIHGGTAEGFAAGLYRDLLGREPDPAGVAGWVARTRAGTSYAELARLMLATDEARRTRVARWYQSDLLRADALDRLKADPGVAVWATLLASA